MAVEHIALRVLMGLLLRSIKFSEICFIARVLLSMTDAEPLSLVIKINVLCLQNYNVSRNVSVKSLALVENNVLMGIRTKVSPQFIITCSLIKCYRFVIAFVIFALKEKPNIIPHMWLQQFPS